ncbi:MAG: hypothetical protein P4L71_20900, partial [Acetobacteraceae bacterium]|nr:hypothetical protein [Acetobacteraceae bacterium]
RLAAAATAAVGRRLTEAHGKVAAMIVALQLGDITRQRIEHMVDAIILMTDLAYPGGDHAAAPVAAGCALAAAQLRDTAVELDQEAERIAGRLASLAEDAREVGRVSEQTYGGADRAHSNCIAKLEQDVRDTSALFEQVWHARDETERRVGEVSDAADRLVAHVRTLGSIEADIHIMGLNTTLKCGRLGTIGRPLSIIAQALRDCGKGVMGQVGTASQQLQQLVALTASLTGAADETPDGGTTGQRPSAARSVADRMLTALGQLSHAGQALVGALAGLQRDSLAASSLLETAAAGFSVHRDLSEVLRSAAATLDGIAAESDTVDADPAATAALLDRVAASYTMARERDIHRRFAPDSAACRTAERAPDALEDMLF